MTAIKEKRFLKDDIAKKILNSEEGREYLIRIIALSLNLDINEVRNNIKMVDTSVSNHEKLKDQETDVLFENDKNVFNIEVNYNSYEEGEIKNRCYIANLMIRQIRSGKSYKEYKKINQINLNNYDLFQEGKFLYRSFIMEERSHQKRDDLLEIIDINLDFLSKFDYTKIKKLNENDLKWLLYIFVCPDKTTRKELYKSNQIMKRVYDLMDNFTKELNEMLYYNPEEFRKMCEFNQGKREGVLEGKQEERTEITKELLSMGVLDIEQIAKVTKMTVEEVKKLDGKAK